MSKYLDSKQNTSLVQYLLHYNFAIYNKMYFFHLYFYKVDVTVAFPNYLKYMVIKWRS